MKLLVMCLGIVTACHCPPSGAPRARATPADTVQGLVVVAGANPGVVLLRATGSAELILLQGRADGALHSVESLEIIASGTMKRGPQGRSLTDVVDFRVVADSGTPTRDGRLAMRGNLLTIVDVWGRASAIVEAPSELSRHIGERVWVAGGVMGPVTGFGVIPELPSEAGPVNACGPSRIQRGGGRG